MGKPKKEAGENLNALVVKELLAKVSGSDTPDAVFDALYKIGTEGNQETALEQLFDAADAHPYAAKLRDKLIKAEFWLERDGSQVGCYVKLAESGVRAARIALFDMADDGSQEAFAWAKGKMMETRDSRTIVNAVEANLVANLAGKQRLLTAHVLQQELEVMRGTLLSDAPTPLERVLVDRIVYCHAAVNHYENSFSRAGSMTLQQGDYHQRTIDKAHRRLLSAVETLARVRRLQIVPAVQVNIAEKQVNVATVHASPGPH